MKIALVNEYYPPFIPGGAELSTQLLAQELAARPEVERVVVITPNHGAASVEEKGKLVIERFPFPFKLHNRRLHAYGLLANPLFYAYCAWQILRVVRKHKLELLHVQNKQSVVGAVWAARWARIPVVVTLRDVLLFCRFGMCLNDFNEHPQGCDLQSYRKCLYDYQVLYMPGIGPLQRAKFWVMGGYHRLDSLLKTSMLRRADAVVTISDKLGEITRSRRVNPRRMETIYNLMPKYRPQSASRRQDDDGWHLFFAGRLSWGKGAQRLIDAIPAVCAALAPKAVHVRLAGEGPLRPILTARAQELGVGDAVTFLGSVPQAEMQGQYEDADVVVVPSVWQEAFGRVALEALISGTPVVASTHGGLAEIVEDGITGEVVDPDPAPLAEAIVKVLRNEPAFRRRVAEALPRLQVKFGRDIGERHVALYLALLKQVGLGNGVP